MTVADYSGVRAGALVYADFAETVNRAGHPTPTVDAPAGSWVVSYWADKSVGDDRLRPARLGDRRATPSAAPAPATSAARSPTPTARCRRVSTAAWSPRPTPPTPRRRPGRSSCARIEPNQAPTASFTYTCDSADCDFDGTDSSDPDGSVVSYAWDFGDGGTATGATPSHDFVTSGTRDVTLTVTDDEGTTGSVVIPVVGGAHQRRTRRRRSRRAAPSSTARFDATASGDSDGTVDVVRVGLRRRRDRHHDRRRRRATPTTRPARTSSR